MITRQHIKYGLISSPVSMVKVCAVAAKNKRARSLKRGRDMSVKVGSSAKCRELMRVDITSAWMHRVFHLSILRWQQNRADDEIVVYSGR
ncbi:hypothetical protein MUK42_27222 [Musa troglodytarum]|uniref:Uncharacterized protein n=1 Tax=Musa troglodytarum TaxID=320322 RepID=A0A9E7EY60_9LILI|nr:hypothetical protein MUK42_27222 [Musa troglodytarum]